MACKADSQPSDMYASEEELCASFSRQCKVSDTGYGSILSEYQGKTKKALRPADKKVLRMNFQYLLEELEPTPIIDRLFEDDDLNSLDVQEAESIKPRARKVEFVLLKMLRSGKADSFVRLLSYLEEEGVQQKHISAHLTDPKNKLRELPDLNSSERDMRLNIETIKCDLRQAVDLRSLAVYFLMYGQLSIDEYEEVTNSEVFVRKRWDRLLQYIIKRLPVSYQVLIVGLDELKAKDLVSLLHAKPLQDSLSRRRSKKQLRTRRFLSPVTADGDRPSKMAKVSDPAATSWNFEKVDMPVPVSLECVKLEFNPKNEVMEMQIVDTLNEVTVMKDINQELEMSTGMIIEKAEYGSVVVYLKRQLSSNREWNSETLKHIATTVTEVVLNKEEVAKLLGDEKIRLNIFACPKYAHDIEFGMTLKSKIHRYKDFLLHEAEPVTFAHILIDSGVWTKSRFDELVHLHSRRSRVDFMIQDLERRPEQDLRRFLNGLKESHPLIHHKLCLRQGSGGHIEEEDICITPYVYRPKIVDLGMFVLRAAKGRKPLGFTISALFKQFRSSTSKRVKRIARRQKRGLSVPEKHKSDSDSALGDIDTAYGSTSTSAGENSIVYASVHNSFDGCF